MTARLSCALALAGLALSACATPATRYPVDTTIAFESLQTTVDSQLAAQYLTRTGRSAELGRKYDGRELSSALLQELAEESSTDFAAVYFARRMLAVPRHRAMQKRFVDTIAALSASGRARIDEADRSQYTFIFVPGLFYVRRPETGAAMARTRALLEERGFDTYLVPTGELSTVEEGAQVLADYLRDARKSNRKIIITSASKGGADVAHALGQLLAGEDLSHVRGWVSIGGVLHGTPLADIGLTWPNSWLLGTTGWMHGTTLGIAHDLSTETAARRTASYTFPEHLQVLHYVGVPVSGTVSDNVRGNYDRMRPYGPNDGVTLLPDQLLPRGHVVLAIGADHRFIGPRSDFNTLALASLIVELVEDPNG